MYGKLRTYYWVQSQIHLCDMAFLPTWVLQSGDPDTGAVMLKRRRQEGMAELYTQVRTFDGKLAWLQSLGDEPVAEDDVDSQIRREMEQDRDLWVLQIDDPRGIYPFDGKVVSGLT